MGDVIFARPRHDYGSYVDLYALIALSGYPLIYFDELDPESDNTYILTIYNGEIVNGWPNVTAQIILWDNEWRLEGDYPHIPGVSRVWASDKWYSEQIQAEFVPMGSHPGLMIGAATLERVYDTVFLGYAIPRRAEIVHQLQARGLRMPQTSAWGTERHKILSRARSMLHVHQHAHAPTIAPLRVALAAAYRLPLIMETPMDRTPLRHGDMLCSDYGNLADFVALWTRRNESRALEEFGRSLYHSLCERETFRSYIEAAL